MPCNNKIMVRAQKKGQEIDIAIEFLLSDFKADIESYKQRENTSIFISIEPLSKQGID